MVKKLEEENRILGGRLIVLEAKDIVVGRVDERGNNMGCGNKL